ncbi:DUF6463 family protein [Kitasatospora sp. NPDC054939]
MNGIARWVPRLILVVAGLHLLTAFAQPNAWGAIARDGFFAAVADHGAADYDAREASVWFLVAGVALAALGTLARHAVRATGRLPAQVGGYLLLIGGGLTVLEFPLTGGWALVLLGAVALYPAIHERFGGAPSAGGPAAAPSTGAPSTAARPAGATSAGATSAGAPPPGIPAERG